MIIESGGGTKGGIIFDAEYTFARHGIVKERVIMKYYEAGHMMYIREADLIQLSADIREFYSQR